MEAPPLRGGGRGVSIQGSRAEEESQVGHQKKKGNNGWGNIGTEKCQHCRKLKAKCHFGDNPLNDCKKCIRTGRLCGPKVLSKPKGPDGTVVGEGNQTTYLDYNDSLARQIFFLIDPKLGKSLEEIQQRINGDFLELMLSNLQGFGPPNEATEEDGDGDDVEDKELEARPPLNQTLPPELFPDNLDPRLTLGLNIVERYSGDPSFRNAPSTHRGLQQTASQYFPAHEYSQLQQTALPPPMATIPSYMPIDSMMAYSSELMNGNPVPSGQQPRPPYPLSRQNSDHSMRDLTPDPFTPSFPPSDSQGDLPSIQAVPRLITAPPQQYGQIFPPKQGSRNVESQLSGTNGPLMSQLPYHGAYSGWPGHRS